jgi:hypothetical protein
LSPFWAYTFLVRLAAVPATVSKTRNMPEMHTASQTQLFCITPYYFREIYMLF